MPACWYSKVREFEPDVLLGLDLRCAHCYAVCVQIRTRCPLHLAHTAGLALRGPSCELRYWPMVVMGSASSVLPSIRPDQPDTPIDPAEIERAKQAMERVSFRRDSASWRAFLARLTGGGMGPTDST